MGWQQKHEQSTALIKQVKQLNASGINDGETADKAHKLFAEAQRLGTEARAEKVEEQKGRLVDLLQAYESNTPNNGVPSMVGNGAAFLSGESAPNSKAALLEPQVLYTKTQAATLNIKALAEGAGATGGFLVPPQYAQEMFAATRRQGNALRAYGWLNIHPTSSSQVLIPRGGGAATVGIVAENATKPTADQSFTQVTVNIFTAAGISKVSKQLYQDSEPTAVEWVAQELGTLHGNLEEQKVLNGTGTGEPRGILNTTGIGSVTVATNTQVATIDGIIDAVANVEQNYFAAPNGILMHPRRLAFIQKGKDTANNYLFNQPGTFRAPGGLGGTIGATSASQGTVANMPGLLGLPIGVSSNLPTNLGAGTNQDIIIVAAWNEAHLFQRQDITFDVSELPGTAFESNQVWTRGESRFGFTAERYPTAFCTIGGAGLIP